MFGTGLGVFKYLETGDPRSREWVENDADEGQELGTEIDLLYGEYRISGKGLMNGKDNQEELPSKIDGDLKEADATLNEEIQANVYRAKLDGSRKVERAARMKVDLNEVDTWLGAKHGLPKENAGSSCSTTLTTSRKSMRLSRP